MVDKYRANQTTFVAFSEFGPKAMRRQSTGMTGATGTTGGGGTKPGKTEEQPEAPTPKNGPSGNKKPRQWQREPEAFTLAMGGEEGGVGMLKPERLTLANRADEGGGITPSIVSYTFGEGGFHGRPDEWLTAATGAPEGGYRIEPDWWHFDPEKHTPINPDKLFGHDPNLHIHLWNATG